MACAPTSPVHSQLHDFIVCVDRGDKWLSLDRFHWHGRFGLSIGKLNLPPIASRNSHGIFNWAIQNALTVVICMSLGVATRSTETQSQWQPIAVSRCFENWRRKRLLRRELEPETRFSKADISGLRDRTRNLRKEGCSLGSAAFSDRLPIIFSHVKRTVYFPC
jgi:hypothetical protein